MEKSAQKHIGIYNTHIASRGGAEKRTFVMAESLVRNYRVSLLVNEAFDVGAMEAYCDVDLSGVQVVVVGDVHRVDSSRALLPSTWLQQARAVRTVALENRVIRALALDLFINNTMASKMICPAPRGIFMCMFPHKPAAPGRIAGVTSRLLGRHPEAYQTYDVITANSEYTAKWIERWWGRKAEVVYSVCDPVGVKLPKDRVILTVGRFSENSRDANYKAQDTLIEVFSGMHDLHAQGWQLHLAGSLPPHDKAASETLAHLEEIAAGLPVFFHVNATLPHLHNLYRRATVYWHGTGYGYAEDEFPSKQEHFGITTVEAMSAGAVPIVINTGGQRETVEHGVSGFRWDTLKELAYYTRQVVGDTALAERLGQAAVAQSDRFSRKQFARKVTRIVEQLLG